MKALHPEMVGFESHLSVASLDQRESWYIRVVLFLVVLGTGISMVRPNIVRGNFAFLPQLLIGLMLLLFYFHLTSQRNLLRRTFTALIAASSYAERLEQFSFFDPKTQLFNRMYLDQLFSQQLRWLNRNGKSATLLLFEVLSDGMQAAEEETVIEAALLLRSNFRGSDYVLRNAANQFLVLMPDTNADQSHYALDRLADKLDEWNLENQGSGMELRHSQATCPPGGDLWDKLHEVEEGLRRAPALRSTQMQQALTS